MHALPGVTSGDEEVNINLGSCCKCGISRSSIEHRQCHTSNHCKKNAVCRDLQRFPPPPVTCENQSLSMSGDPTFTGPGHRLGEEHEWTGNSLSGLHIWVDLGDILSSPNRECAVAAASGSNSELIVDLDFQGRCREEAVSYTKSALNHERKTPTCPADYDFDSIEGRLLQSHSHINTKAKEVKVAYGAPLIGEEDSDTGRCKDESGKASHIGKERRVKRVRFSDHVTTIYFPEFDVKEVILSHDDRNLHIDDCGSSAGISRVLYSDNIVEGSVLTNPNDDSGSEERKSVAFDTAQADAGPADSVVSLQVQTDEICERQSKSEDALENFDRSDVFSKDVDATKMSLGFSTSTFLDLCSGCSNVRPENHVSLWESESTMGQKWATSFDAPSQVGNVGSEMDDPDFETTIISAEILTYCVDRLFALDPSLSLANGHGPSWTIDFCEDSRKLTFKRKGKARKGDKKASKRRKQDEAPSRSRWGLDCSLSSDDLEADDDVLGRPLWRRQYKSINALAS